MFKALRAFNVVGPYKMLSRGLGVGRVAPPIWCHHFPSTQYGTHTDQLDNSFTIVLKSPGCVSLGWIIGNSSWQLLTQGEGDSASGLWAWDTEAS